MALFNPEKAEVVFTLKRQPPINFNIVLHKHALEHGLHIGNIGYHPHSSGAKLSLYASGQLGNAKIFADSAIRKFSTYLYSAEVKFGKQAGYLR